MPPSLPYLTDKPAHHPDSCLSLSIPLLDLLQHTIPSIQSPKILSIGSGSGLLEALLQTHISSHTSQSTAAVSSISTSSSSNVIVHGIEPQPGVVNRYLPGSALHLVAGTWALYEHARSYHVWLFVYARDVRLVSKYLDLLTGVKRGSDDGDVIHDGRPAVEMDSTDGDDGADAGAEDRFEDGLESFHGVEISGQHALDKHTYGKTIVWAGPRADWVDFESCFRRRGIVCAGLYPGDSGGVAEWEVVCVFRWIGDGFIGERVNDQAVGNDDQWTSV